MYGYVQEERIVPPLSDKGVNFFKMPVVGARSMATQTQQHDAIEIIYMKTGSVTINIDGGKYDLYPGDLAFVRSRGVHNIYTLDQEVNDYYVLKLMPKFIYDICPQDGSSNFANRFSVFDTSLKTVFRKEELEESEIKRNLDSLIEGLKAPSTIPDVCKILATLNILKEIYLFDQKIFNKITKVPDTIFDIVSYVNVWFEMNITAEDMAKRANMSYAHFCRSFLKATGKNFRDYLNFVRIKNAETLILNTDLPITEISLKCGYQTVSHFTVMYKRLKGVSPTAHRKSLLK